MYRLFFSFLACFVVCRERRLGSVDKGPVFIPHRYGYQQKGHDGLSKPHVVSQERRVDKKTYVILT